MCPFASPDVTALSERKRPVCAYEREAYAIAMRIPDMEWSAAAHSGRPDLHTDAGGSAPQPEDSATSSGAGVLARGSSSTPSTESTPTAPLPGVPPPDSPLRKLPFALSEPHETPREGIITQLRYRATPFFSTRGAKTKFPRTGPDSIADASDASGTFAPSDPAPTIIEDTGAILYAMLQRATLTLSATALTDHTEAESARYTMRSTKPSAALTAFLRIGRELRAWMRLRPESIVAPAAAQPGGPGFGDEVERPRFTEDGYFQFYDHKGNLMSFPSLMHPFLDELDAAVEQLRSERSEERRVGKECRL